MASRGLSPKYVWRRRIAAVTIVAVALIVGYYAWFRDSSLVAVNDVKVEGATTNQEQIAAALTAAAEEMTTLNVDDEKLREVASQFPTVATISADASLLHSLTIHVTERPPVGTVEEGGERVAVSADGFLLPGIEAEGLPPLKSTASGPKLTEEGLDQAAIAGAAPAELRERINGVSWDAETASVTVDLDGAPELRFGDGTDAEEKWKAAVAVLAGPELGSPAYLDVSVPGRPVTGGIE